MCLWHVLVQHCSKEQFIFNPLHLPCSLFQKKIPSYIDQGSTAPYIAYNEFLKKVPKGGGHFQSNTADFGNFKQGFLIMKLIQNNDFRVQGMFFFSTIVSLLYLEISVHAFHTIQSSNQIQIQIQKFIRFGIFTLPLHCLHSGTYMPTYC